MYGACSMITNIDEFKDLLNRLSEQEDIKYLLFDINDKSQAIASSAGIEANCEKYLNNDGKELLWSIANNSVSFKLLTPDLLNDTTTDKSIVIAFTLLNGYSAILLLGKFIHSFSHTADINRLLKYSREVFFSFDLEQKKLNYISQSVKDVLGYDEGDLINKSLEELAGYIHPEDSDLLEQSISFEKETSDERPFTIDFRLKDKLGIFIYVQIKVVIQFENEIPIYVFCSLNDISKQKEAEAVVEHTNNLLNKLEDELDTTKKELAALKLQQDGSSSIDLSNKSIIGNEEAFKQLTENTNDIFWLRDKEKILYINNQFEKIWGRSKDELIANPNKITEWIYPEDLPNIEVWVNLEMLTKDSPYVEQYRIVKPDGELRWLWSRVFPVFNDAGKPYRLVGISSDITEQKDFEEALTIAKEKAQESDMLKSTFLANISHEIRTPMNGIVGFSELIARDDLDSDTRKNYVSIMKKSSEQLVRIIDDIIDFAKLEANQIRISPDKFDVNKLLDEVFIFFENRIAQSDNSSITLLLNKSLSDNEANLISDEHRIRQVISYLIDNALKYTDEGFIEIGYKIINDKVEFYVKDSGIGIPTNKQAIIFERFRQADEGHTRKYGGTGLGLPIASGLVNLLGGEMRFDSEENKGTTFFFTVPYRIEELIERDTEEPLFIDEQYNWKDKIILVAEDDELNFEYMKIILESSQAKVIRAKDGSQAVKMCSNLNFDIILMDIRLPILNGIQATQQLREMGIKTPIIAQTAFAMDDDEHKCLSAGCDRYITKPISKDKLFSTIDELL